MSKAAGLGPASKVGATETLLEVTEWPDGTLNHTYLVDKGKGWLLGYRNVLTGAIQMFALPKKQFSKSKRKFKKVVDAELSRAYNT